VTLREPYEVREPSIMREPRISENHVGRVSPP